MFSIGYKTLKSNVVISIFNCPCLFPEPIQSGTISFTIYVSKDVNVLVSMDDGSYIPSNIIKNVSFNT